MNSKMKKNKKTVQIIKLNKLSRRKRREDLRNYIEIESRPNLRKQVLS